MVAPIRDVDESMGERSAPAAAAAPLSQLAVVAALVFAVISPAFAQPFADTSPNHWAYDAFDKLTAKGLILGYPDGIFKRDGAMTRHEMAMAVARLLARIESI